MLRAAGIVLLIAGFGSTLPNYEDSNLKVVGGKEISIDRAPYQVGVENSSAYICSGSIISESWILTAASCIVEIKDPHLLQIRAGSALREKRGEVYKVKSLLYYADKYVPETQSYDVGLISTMEPFFSSPRVQVIGLVPRGVEPVGSSRLFVSGWGKKGVSTASAPEDDNKLSRPVVLNDYLLGLTLISVPRGVCKLMYSARARHVDQSMICAAGKHWKGPCEGDLGGPLVNDLRQLVGVASWGIGCGFPGLPHAFADIANEDIRKWIADKTGIK